MHDYSDAIALVGLNDMTNAINIPSGHEKVQGDIIHTGNYTLTGDMLINGNLTVTGTITAPNIVVGTNITVNGKSVDSHNHNGTVPNF